MLWAGENYKVHLESSKERISISFEKSQHNSSTVASAGAVGTWPWELLPEGGVGLHALMRVAPRGAGVAGVREGRLCAGGNGRRRSWGWRSDVQNQSPWAQVSTGKFTSSFQRAASFPGSWLLPPSSKPAVEHFPSLSTSACISPSSFPLMRPCGYPEPTQIIRHNLPSSRSLM